MRTRLTSGIAILVLGAAVGTARADATADGRAVSDAFEKAVAAGDVQAVMALYRDDASVIWPGQGEEAHGKAAIEQLARKFLATMKGTRLVLKSQETIALGEGYLVNLGHWETSSGSGRRRVSREIRTSEVLAKTDGKWLYRVDHASIGLPPPPPRREGRR